MAKNEDLILRIRYTDGSYTDYNVDNKNDMAFLVNKITRAMDEHKSVKICDNIVMNANNIIFVEELKNGYKS